MIAEWSYRQNVVINYVKHVFQKRLIKLKTTQCQDNHKTVYILEIASWFSLFWNNSLFMRSILDRGTAHDKNEVDVWSKFIWFLIIFSQGMRWDGRYLFRSEGGGVYS